MSVLQRLVREPVLIAGVVITGLNLAVLLGLDLSAEAIAGVGTFLGAVVALLRYLVTPSAEVVVQEKPNGEIVAGAAAMIPTGSRLDVVEATPVGAQHPDVRATLVVSESPFDTGPGEGGYVDTRTLAVAALVIGVVLVVLLVL